MQNSVAKYPLDLRWPAPPAPAPRRFEKVSGRPVDGLEPGLWCCLSSGGHTDSLTVKIFTVKALSKRQAVEYAVEYATFDELTAKQEFHSYVRTHARAHMNLCMCHIVNSSIIYNTIYISILYTTDSALTVTDSAMAATCRKGGPIHSLCSAGGWGGAH